MPVNVNRTGFDRFARLKALERPSTLPPTGLETQPDDNQIEEGPVRRSQGEGTASERLALILGASVKRNGHGEHLSLHCWHGGHAPCVPDVAALSLLAPDARERIADPEQWLFLDTETTGLMGGDGNVPVSGGPGVVGGRRP